MFQLPEDFSHISEHEQLKLIEAPLLLAISGSSVVNNKAAGAR